MLAGQRIAVVLPAYNAARTLERTVSEIDREIVDDLILTDDASTDTTPILAKSLGLYTIIHDRNRGYGANQKTCYTAALGRGADIVVMLHPDYQYSPRLIPAMASMIVSGHYDAVLASRIMGVGALAGGMPLWKFLANRALTLAENLLLAQHFSEYHTGFPTRYFKEASSINFQRSVTYGFGVLDTALRFRLDSAGIRPWPLLGKPEP
ncbi:glycosyltransferase family 2 protein [Acidiphilium sp. 34-64-41]|uniref:glycosyltransferase family 2 protein n=1 Tax=Acidiphilium sp. 34-64-41 TaxID=1970297 RepID=UPI000BD2598B|nr:glycosyltransferase family 2 protein [Acidiphilium sp. 34-64-41]OZB25205.1 MAG: glycosyl transferase family 2 [Acidiphilium sp. 34-64-41]